MTNKDWIIIKKPDSKHAYIKLNTINGVVFGITQADQRGNITFGGNMALISASGINVICDHTEAKKVLKHIDAKFVTT